MDYLTVFIVGMAAGVLLVGVPLLVGVVIRFVSRRLAVVRTKVTEQQEEEKPPTKMTTNPYRKGTMWGPRSGA
jgi:hypothetical protein